VNNSTKVMPPKRKKYKIVKVSLGYEPQFRSPVFEPVSRLYMELLENKTKIKEGLRKLEFESKQFGGSQAPSLDVAHKEAMNDANKDINESNEGSVSSQGASTSFSTNDTSQGSSSPRGENKFIKAYQDAKEYTPPGSRSSPKVDDEGDFHHGSQNGQGEYKAGMFKTLLHPKGSSSQAGSNKFIIGDDEEPLLPGSSKSSSSGSPRRSKSAGDSLSKIMRGEVSDDEDHSSIPAYTDFISGKPSSSALSLSSLNATAASLSSSKEESYRPQAPPPPVQAPSSRMIPSLEAISKNQVPLMSSGDVSSGPNVANMSYTGTEKDIQRKRDLLYKFKILKRQYTNGFVPEVNEFMDLHDLEREYDSVTRQLRLDDQVENYKKYLMMGFWGLEMVLKTFLKFQDIEGFASQQIAGINQYEKILLEIGEKHSVSVSSQWPPELRLAGIVLMNAAVFLGSKMLFKGGSSGMMSSLFGGSSKPASSSPLPMNFGGSASSGSSVPKKKMRGPDLDIEDLDAKKSN
jgi:hypothetical protein